MKFNILPSDTAIWNVNELIKFLVDNQHQSIELTFSIDGPSAEETGLYRLLDSFSFKSVNIITANLLETHSKYQIIHLPLRFAKVRNLVNDDLHIWNQQKIFGAFFGRPIWHRMGIAAYLNKNYMAQSIISLRGNVDDEDNRKLFETSELFSKDPAGIELFSKMYTQLPMLIEQVDGYTPGPGDTTTYTEQLANFYINILIDIVAETYTSGSVFFPTEKTFRPVLMKKPFIIMGPRNNLAYLKQMGFKTFSDFWDESYDGYDGKDRYFKILNLIDTLAKKSKVELNEMYLAMKYTLDYNYDLLTTQKYKTTITNI